MSQMEHTQLTQHEQLSALHDGHLSREQALALVRASLQDDSLMQQWRSLSVASDVLRAQADQPTAPALRAELAIAPHMALPSVASSTAPLSAPSATPSASNDSRWKIVAGVASLAAVGSLIWGLIGSSGSGAPQGAVLAGNSQSSGAVSGAMSDAVLVSTPSLSPSTAQEATMIRNPRLDEFLAAHKQFGGVSALQQPVGSLRQVSVAAPRP